MTKEDAPLDVLCVSELDAGLELCVIGRVHWLLCPAKT